MRHDAPAVAARPRADVHQVIRRADDVLVVLDHEHRVADVGQPAQRGHKPVVVALVKPDRGLVEHVARAHEPRANLRREPDALRLAARQGAALAVEREVAQSHRGQEPQARVDLLHDRCRDHALFGAELKRAEELRGALYREPGGLRNADVAPGAAHDDRERLRPQPRAVARGARRVAHVPVQPLLHELRLRLVVAPAKVRHHALEREPLRAGLQPLIVGALHQDAAQLGRERLERRRRIRAGHRAEVAQLARVPDVHAPAVAAPRLDRALGHPQRRVGHDERLVERVDAAEPAACGARAVGAVEGEEARLELVDRALRVVRAGESLAEAALLPGAAVLLDQRKHRSVACLECGLHALRDALPVLGRDGDAVDHRLDVVQLVAAEAERVLAAGLERIAKVDHVAVDACAHEPSALQVLEHVLVEPLLAAHDRRADHRALSGCASDERIDNLRWRSGRDRPPAHMPRFVAVPAPGLPASCPHQSQVVVDLGGGGHGRPWRVAAAALLDRDRWGEPVDRVDVGLLHLVEELACVRGEALHVLALALGEDRVERERALAAARNASDDDKLVARDVDIHRLEVVLARAAHTDRACRVDSRR